MTSQPVQQRITVHILPNISQSKDKKVMKFGQIIENDKKNVFPQKSCREWARETSSRPLFPFKKKLVSDLFSLFPFSLLWLLQKHGISQHNRSALVARIFSNQFY